MTSVLMATSLSSVLSPVSSTETTATKKKAAPRKKAVAAPTTATTTLPQEPVPVPVLSSTTARKKKAVAAKTVTVAAAPVVEEVVPTIPTNEPVETAEEETPPPNIEPLAPAVVIPPSPQRENIILQLNINPSSVEQLTGDNFETQFCNYEPRIDLPSAFEDIDGFVSQPSSIFVEGTSSGTSGESGRSLSAEKVDKETLATEGGAHNNNNNNNSNGKIKKPVQIRGGSSPEEESQIFNHLSSFIARDMWPIATNVSCFWCCHSFNHTPFGLPLTYKNEKFHVHGCFCSLSCAAAYNFQSKEILHEPWESFQLLNMMAKKLNMEYPVRMAPPRTALTMFGGYMDIETFRASSSSYKRVTTNHYPMVACVQQLEEVNDTLQSSKKYASTIDRQKLVALEKKIKLERKKPLFTSSNTLEHTMKFQIQDEPVYDGIVKK